MAKMNNTFILCLLKILIVIGEFEMNSFETILLQRYKYYWLILIYLRSSFKNVHHPLVKLFPYKKNCKTTPNWVTVGKEMVIFGSIFMAL